MKPVLYFAAASVGLWLLSRDLPGAAVVADDPCSYVDPFIGTDGGGNIVPGPCLPFGMVKLSPDCDLDFSNSGYVSGRPIVGFSHTHVSGTGGGPKYGNILVMATTGDPDPGNHASSAADETASPGFFGVTLTRFGIKAALSATPRTGFHQYTFPATTQANVLIDAGSFLGQHYAHAGERQLLVGSEVRILNDATVEGYSRVRGGWNAGDAYTVFFYAVFDTPAAAVGTWKSGRITPGGRREFDSGEPTGAFLNFDTRSNRTVRMKVGISYLGCENARHHLEQESPGWDLEAVRQSAAESWRQALRPVAVAGGDEALKHAFYTALYHTMLMPVDKTGENPRWSSGEPYYDDFYAIWDTFRTNHPLLTLLKESVQVEIVRSLIDIAEHDGFLPDARSGDCNGRTQGGSNADIVIADACAKELPGIDYARALRAIRRDAEVPPGGDERKEGRGGWPIIARWATSQPPMSGRAAARSSMPMTTGPSRRSRARSAMTRRPGTTCSSRETGKTCGDRSRITEPLVSSCRGGRTGAGSMQSRKTTDTATRWRRSPCCPPEAGTMYSMKAIPGSIHSTFRTMCGR